MAKNKTNPKNIRRVSVSSRRLYLFRSFRDTLIIPVKLFNSSCVSTIFCEELSRTTLLVSPTLTWLSIIRAIPSMLSLMSSDFFATSLFSMRRFRTFESASFESLDVRSSWFRSSVVRRFCPLIHAFRYEFWRELRTTLWLSTSGLILLSYVEWSSHSAEDCWNFWKNK